MTIGSYTISFELIAGIIAFIAMIVGLAGLVIPLIPGLIIIWLAALGYGIATGFDTLGWIMFAVMTVLMIAGSQLDHLLMGAQAYKKGAPLWAILIALVMYIAGSFVVPIIGGIVAAILALFIVERIRTRENQKALESVRGMLIGFAVAVAVRFVAGVMMIGSWLVWAFV
jgi:uncharacterized protein YqgC (DUF456 family)